MLPISSRCHRVMIGVLLAAALYAPVARAADFTPPSLGAGITIGSFDGSTVYAGTSVRLNTSYRTDDPSAPSCVLNVNGISSPISDVTFTPDSLGGAGFITVYHTFSSAGSYTVTVVCTDADFNTGVSPSRTVDVINDITPPTVVSITPGNATVGVPVTFYASVSDNVRVTECSFVVDSSIVDIASVTNEPLVAGSVPLLRGAASYTYTFTTPVDRYIDFACRDARGNWSEVSGRRVYPTSPASPPATPSFQVGLPRFDASAIHVGTSVNVSATYTNPGLVGISACYLYVTNDSGSRAGDPALMTNIGGSTVPSGSLTTTFTARTAGNYEAIVQCNLLDSSTSATFSPRLPVTILSAPTTPPVTDTISPTVTNISSPSATLGSPATFTASYADNIGVTRCILYIDNVAQGDGLLAGSSVSKSFVFLTTGTHTARFECMDAAGNRGSSSIASVSVTGIVSPAVDTTRPTLGAVTPSSAAVSVPTNYAISYSDAVGVTSCLFYADGILIGSTDRVGSTSGSASRTHTFNSSGTHTVHFVCSDGAGNQTESSRYSVNVLTPSSPPTISPSPAPSPAPAPIISPGPNGTATMGSLIKLICPPVQVGADHPCKAVYYYGRDGKRHAFPNERVYFTWYNSFDGVIELPATSLAAISLGKNVTYRPGSRMVKFLSLSRVYAVSAKGLLRWVASEDMARTLYGTNWNRSIHDINDVFFADYRFGTDVSIATPFNVGAESAAITNIDLNL